MQKHLLVNKIISRNKVQCKCGKIIKLHRAYNPQNLETHNKTSSCLLTKGIRPLTDYFTTTTRSGNPCIGLRNENHVKYLQRIGGIIHYGGAPRVEVLGKELFPRKFKKSFSWKRLTSKETAQLENELAARAKWRNDFSAGCIRSIECEMLTVNKENICNKCMELNSDKILKVFTITKSIKKLFFILIYI